MKRVTLLALAIAVSGCAAAAQSPADSSPDPNPLYKGRRLSEWAALLRSSSDADRIDAIDVLWTLPADVARRGNDAIPPLIEAIRDEQLPDMARISAAHGLAEIGPEAREALPFLVEALETGPPGLKRAAAQACGAVGAPGAISHLAESLRDEDVGVREAAATALGRMGRSAFGAVRALGWALMDRESRVRLAAASALEDIGPTRDVIDVLIHALEDESADVREAAAAALGAAGDEREKVTAALRHRAADPDGCVSVAASLAHWRLSRDPSVIARLVRHLKDKDETVRVQAARALEKIGRPAKGAIPFLTDVLSDESPDVREAGAWALHEIDAREAQKIAARLRE